MMSVVNEILSFLSLEYISDAEYERYKDIAREICSRLDTINAIYVTKSSSVSYLQRLETLSNQPMGRAEQDEYIEKMRKMQGDIDLQNKEKNNFNRLSRIIVDLFSNLYQDILQHHTPPSKCPTVLSKSVRLFPEELQVLRRVQTNNSYRECDIGLMYKVLRNTCFSLPAPSAGWNKPVPTTACGISDDIERIRQIRNKAPDRISSMSMSEAEYKQYVNITTDICKRMDTINKIHLQKSVPGTYLQQLNNILTENLNDTQIGRALINQGR